MASTIYEIVTPFCKVSSPVLVVNVRDYKEDADNYKIVNMINKVVLREMIK